MRFTKIKENTFENLQVNAGILLKSFDPTGVVPIVDDDIISATTGGINATCVPTYIDLGEDIDNCPMNIKELKIIDTWECKMATTLLGADINAIKLMLGCADKTGGVIKPRATLKQDDFQDIWWVGDRADGGMYAIKLINALSDSGFSIQTTDKGKGQFAFSLTGHPSITNQDVVPMEFYVADPEA